MALALLTSQFAIGFVEGLAATPDQAQAQFMFSTFVSFVTAGTIFWFFATRQESRPFTHAVLGLVVMVGLAIGLATAVFTWLGGNFHMVLAAAESLRLAAALAVGTYMGIRYRRRFGVREPDA